MTNKLRHSAFSLMELMAAVVIVGIVAAYIVTRAGGYQATAKKNACAANKGEIELQTKLWRRNNGSYPVADLSNVSGNAAYFPQGLPTCPVDGTAYTISTTTGKVIGHNH